MKFIRKPEQLQELIENVQTRILMLEEDCLLKSEDMSNVEVVEKLNALHQLHGTYRAMYEEATAAEPDQLPGFKEGIETSAVSVQDDYKLIIDTIDAFRKQYGHGPERKKLAELANLSEDRIKKVLSSLDLPWSYLMKD